MGRSSQNRLLLCLCWNKLLWFQAKFLARSQKSFQINPNFMGSSINHRWTLVSGRILKRRIDDGGDSEDGVLVSQSWGGLMIDNGVTGFSDLFKNNIDRQTKQRQKHHWIPKRSMTSLQLLFLQPSWFQGTWPPLWHIFRWKNAMLDRGKVKHPDFRPGKHLELNGPMDLHRYTIVFAGKQVCAKNEIMVSFQLHFTISKQVDNGFAQIRRNRTWYVSCLWTVAFQSLKHEIYRVSNLVKRGEGWNEAEVLGIHPLSTE